MDVGDHIHVYHVDDYYEAKITERDGGKVRIHYVGWAMRYDEWLSEDSDRILRRDEDGMPCSTEQECSESTVVASEKFIDDMSTRSSTNKRKNEEEHSGGARKRPSIQLRSGPLGSPDVSGTPAGVRVGLDSEGTQAVSPDSGRDCGLCLMAISWGFCGLSWVFSPVSC